MYSTYQLNKQEQADHTRQAAIAKPVRKIPEKPELVVSSSCRGTKAAFGVMRHSDEVIAKSGNGLCLLTRFSGFMTAAWQWRTLLIAAFVPRQRLQGLKEIQTVGACSRTTFASRLAPTVAVFL